MITLKDGIYIGLAPEKYFAADRLGSTDLKTLHNHPADWFYSSRHNADREETEASEEMEFGSALHVLVLEGDDAYAKAIIVRPSEYPDAKTGELKKWNGNATFCKTWLEVNDRPDVIILTESADRRVRHMAALILNHPELGQPMSKGLSEVSVLWTHSSGIKLRARFDKLLPKFTLDLKSYGGNSRGVDLTQQCLWLVKDRHMDVQRFLYFLARQAMAHLCAEGAIFGATPAQTEWLTKVSVVEDWRWGWLFYRRRDDKKGHAPMIKPIYRSHFDGTFESGRQKVEVGLQNYRTFVDRFGFDVPWAVVEPGEEPADHQLPIGLNDCPPPVTFPAQDIAA